MWLYMAETDCRQLSNFVRYLTFYFKGCMDLPKSYTTRLVALVLKIWLTLATGLVLGLGLGIGLCLGEPETCCVIGLDISVSETRGSHTDHAKPDLLCKFNSEDAKIPELPDD